MLREGRTSSSFASLLDALPRRVPASSETNHPSINLNPTRIQSNSVDYNNNHTMNDTMIKKQLPLLVMPPTVQQVYSQQQQSMESSLVTNASQQSASSLPPPSSEVHSHQSNVSNERKRPSSNSYTPVISAKRQTTCLPFGYCLDTVENDCWLMNEDIDEMKLDQVGLLPSSEDDVWMYSDDRTPDLLLSNNPWITNRKSYRNSSKVMRDVGPTLAQLNSSDVWDSLDLDELLSCSTTTVGTSLSSAMNATPKNSVSTNHGNQSFQVPSNCGVIGTIGKPGQMRVKKEKENIEVIDRGGAMSELSDPKLQANVEYLQNLLVTNSVNHHQQSSSNPSSDPHPSSINSNPSSQKILPSSEKISPSSQKILPSSEKILPSSQKILPSSEKILPSSKSSFGRKDNGGTKCGSIVQSSVQIKKEVKNVREVDPVTSDPRVNGLLTSFQLEKGGKRRKEMKRREERDLKKESPKILGSILNVKQEAGIESIPFDTSDFGGKKKVTSNRRVSADSESSALVRRRTRNSNSQCTERSSGSSNDEGFVEDTSAIEDSSAIDDTLAVDPSDHGQAEDMDEVDMDDDNESEVMDSDDESFYGDYEAKDLLGASTSDDQENRWALNMGRSRKGGPQRYFWQYNVQAKGPKGSKSSLGSDGNDTILDPHVIGEVSDPVFAPDCQVAGVKHAGKARRGDGNDLTPNPRKLLMIGLELKKLSRIINDLTPVSDVPVAARNKTRKEKNKLASRACRLKKKAQHEANKIKLFGLQNEHKKMLKLLTEIKSQVRNILTTSLDGNKLTALTSAMANLFNEGVGKVVVAGNTSDFVNSVLDNVAAGQTDGGLH